MTRIRMLLIAMGLSIATLMLLTETQAQGPGGRGNRGGGGPGGFGGGGPGGFGGGGPGGFGGGGPGGRGFGGGGTNFGLLASPQVQADVKVTDAQVTKLESVRKKADDARQKMFAAQRGNRGGRGGNNNNNAADDPADGGGGGGGQGGFQAIRQAMTELQQETDAAYSRILSPSQVNRLGQIALQQQGIFAIIRPDLAEKLNMSEDQVAQIQGIRTEMQQEQRKARTNQRNVFRQFETPNGGVDIASLRDKMDSAEFKVQVAANNKAAEEAETIHKQATAAVAKLLTKKQKDSYNRMIGEPFDTTKMTFNRDGTFISAAGSTATASSGRARSTTTTAATSDDSDAPPAKAAAPTTATKKKGAVRSRRDDD